MNNQLENYSIENLGAEQSILGSILLNKDCIDVIGDYLKSEDFNRQAHNIIYDCMIELNKKRKPIDLITLTEKLKSKGYLDTVGGISYITSLSTIVPTTSNIKYYADIVKDLSNKRNIIRASYELIENIRDQKDIDSSLAIFENRTKETHNIKSDNNTLDDIMASIFEELQNKKTEDKIKTKISVIDKHTNGIGKKELVAIGAGSGVGKSAISLKIALEAYKQNKKVLIISREMSKEQVAERIILHHTGISKIKYENRNFTDQDWIRIVDAMQTYTAKKLIKIDDKIATIQGIKREIRDFKPDLVIVDYVQLLTPNSTQDTRERQVAELSRELKNITLDFEISVIQLTQLAEKGNGNFRPRGESYTRESRAIYHDSNVVIYIHRVTEEKELEQAYNKIPVFKERGNFEDMKATIENYDMSAIKFIEIIVDKNRTGTTGSDYYWFKGSDLSYSPII